METVSDFYAKLNKPDTPVEPDVPDTPLNSELIESNLAKNAKVDEDNESTIQINTDSLINHLDAFNTLIDASYELLKYVPDTINSDQDKLWKEEVSRFVIFFCTLVRFHIFGL